MPTYEYRCANGHAFERVQKMSDPPLDRCEVCGAEAVRSISGGAGLIFKGTGFYITDYGKDGKGVRKDGDAATPAAATTDAKPDAAATTRPEAKPEPKADPKPAPKADTP